MEDYINKEVSDALAKEVAEKIVGQIRTRVPKGERYWYIGADKCIPVLSYDMRTLFDDDRYRSGNYYTDDSEAEAMAEKIRKVLKGAWVLTPPEGEIFSRKVEAVLKGAEVIEMPSEEEMLNSIPSDWSSEQYMSGAGIGWHRCYDWIKSKIVK